MTMQPTHGVFCAEVVHELSSCLAQTAEQQQLLTDAARLLVHGEVSPAQAAFRLQRELCFPLFCWYAMVSTYEPLDGN